MKSAGLSQRGADDNLADRLFDLADDNLVDRFFDLEDDNLVDNLVDGNSIIRFVFVKKRTTNTNEFDTIAKIISSSSSLFC